MTSDFVEAKGFIHLLNPNNAEYTLCGDAFDLASDVEGYGWRPTTKRTVTCPHCCNVIMACRGVRTGPVWARKGD